ncbi:U4/U6.U5 tri-snRNP-associated protein, putative [Phytophthora infestans T30-4]|uniref:U4/U6.U5 tri-snRNP-associated protein, putative n=1 Tax=Phytophthora infestans (strain T30-4) TaxID=403677 RepID=D0NCD2_PHYIT|nr:U4/U6.U5 tri-snRNP-associated protein, putative [Phytophthora infestans T30-4]EEY55646.1 U4/U6.U5 tri-snRNP-associated protein, putative [Phytophthora infestans T30-4]|eukprot:XP_002903222.1 U4/U6.U5 tri-snRNP-associated protein, putative [Phytophthora infestans T30-4]
MSRSRSPVRSRRHGGSSSSSRRDRHAPSSRRRSRSRSRHRDDPPASSEDKSGEISLSIEETNKLRISLGLKPLSVGPSKKEQSVVNVQKTSAQLDAERKQQELKKKLQQSKTRRELTQKIAGKSLGEQLKADLEAQKKGNDALEWKEEKYDASALAGMTVGHSLDNFEDGQEIVLTLKDQRVLGEDGKDLNELDDELVNVELSEKDRRLARQERAKRAVLPVYTGYDDDEFIEMGSSRKRKSGPKLLAHYDEEQEAVDAAEARKFTLDASGGSKALESEKKQEEDEDVAVISLAMDKTKRVEDYYTKEEVEAQFAKKSKKLRKKKKSRQEETDASSLVAQLEQEALQSGASSSKDRGKRKRTRDAEEAEEEENLLRFQEAREKANAVASEALAASKKKRKRRVADDSELADDVALEMELGASLARARQIAQLASQTISLEEEKTKAVGHVFGETNTTANTVVFNEATDFETRLRDAMEKRAAQFQAAAEGALKQEENVEIEEKKEENNSEDEETQEKEVWGEEQPLVGTGMGATLALLRKTGDLRQTRVERQAGRANDARDRSFEDDLRIKNGVKLDYRDEFGRLLTKKEAFRMLSYKFHGHEPGKKKKEKRLRQLKEELEAQKMLSGEGSTKMMKVLEKKQKHTKEAHVVLSSGV